MSPAVLYALEEELYATEPRRPSLQSLYYLARLMWRDPGYYYVHTASNFARGDDVRQGLMSGIEISTAPHADIDALVEDLRLRRRALAAVCDALLVPVGHLFDYRAPTNTCGLHVHIGPLAEIERVYGNLAHFLPLLALMSANSPYASGATAGLSFRIAHSYAIGPLRADPRYRFQDLIVSRRLGTLEIRIFDPFWDLARLRALLSVIDAVVRDPGVRPLDLAAYAAGREELVRQGFGPRLQALYEELQGLIALDRRWFERPPALEVVELVERNGVVGAYSAIDNAYRGGPLAMGPVWVPQRTAGRVSRSAVGVAGYYMLRLPYVLRKVWAEWS